MQSHFLIQLGFLSSQKYDQWGNVACHGNDSDIREGHKSFPSGHTSCKIILSSNTALQICMLSESCRL